MPEVSSLDGFSGRAYVVTGPTSGIGWATALELDKHGTVILVGRDAKKLDEVRKAIEGKGQRAAAVACDLSDLASVRRAAMEIVALALSIAGLLNNAGILEMHATKSAEGWDLTFVTDHLGPFELTEALMPHLPDGASVVFVVSGVEDPERKPAVASGFRGGRYISVEASARGEWTPGGSSLPGGDAYATSKQFALATAIEFARENPRLHINAVEPGFTPNTGLGRDSSAGLRFLMKYMLPLLAPFVKYWSTPKRAARVITGIMISTTDQTGIYCDDSGHPMVGSKCARDPKFTSRVVAETRAFLSATHSKSLGAPLDTDQRRIAQLNRRSLPCK